MEKIGGQFVLSACIRIELKCVDQIHLAAVVFRMKNHRRNCFRYRTELFYHRVRRAATQVSVDFFIA